MGGSAICVNQSVVNFCMRLDADAFLGESSVRTTVLVGDKSVAEGEDGSPQASQRKFKRLIKILRSKGQSFTIPFDATDCRIAVDSTGNSSGLVVGSPDITMGEEDTFNKVANRRNIPIELSWP